MTDKPKDLVQFRDIDGLPLWKDIADIWQVFMSTRIDLVQIFRLEGDQMRSYRLILKDGKFTAESDERKIFGEGPQKSVDINLGPFFISKAVLQELESTYTTLTRQKDLAACRKAERFTALASPASMGSRIQQNSGPEKVLQNFCQDIVANVADIAKEAKNSIELRTNAKSGVLAIRGETPVPDPMYYYSDFDDFTILASKMATKYTYFETHEFDSAILEPEMDYSEYYQRRMQLVLPPRNIEKESQLEKEYEPFMKMHSEIYHLVRKTRTWQTSSNTNIDNILDFLLGDTFEVSFDERIVKSRVAKWTIAIVTVP